VAKSSETKNVTAAYEFVPQYEKYEDGEPVGKPRKFFADDLQGNRVEVKPGTRFVAELVEDTVIDRRGVTPKEVPIGSFSVVASDIDVHPGCLTSCIRTGRAVLVK
jgi:hypothetical protein